MSTSDETVRILAAEQLEQLGKVREEELLKILKLRLVLKELSTLRLPSGDDADKQVERALELLTFDDYIRLSDNDNDYLLNLGDCHSTSLSYTERKAVRQQLTTNLQNKLRPIADFGKKMRSKIPEIFAPATSSSRTATATVGSNSDTQSIGAQIVALEAQRLINLEKLARLRNRKCSYLKAAAELKIGPYLAHDLELLLAQTQLNQAKAEILHAYLVNELVTRSEHSVKAIKEVEGYIDKQLE